MEPYIYKLDDLIALKQNKGHKITKKESEEFVSAWSELIAAEGGFSEKAEQYFYDGLGDDDTATISINNYGPYGACRELLDYDWFADIVEPEVTMAVGLLIPLPPIC